VKYSSFRIWILFPFYTRLVRSDEVFDVWFDDEDETNDDGEDDYESG